MLNTQSITTIFERFQSQNPHPKTELIYHSPFELLIAVILSAQATDKSVNAATPALFKLANTPEAMLQVGLAKITELVKTIGLYRNKAKHIYATCQKLVKEFHSTVPCDRESLESLPGVGRKTANVILNTCFHIPTIAVDTHIFRVANRIGLAKGKTPLTVERALLKRIPPEYLLDAHHWLILHGRYQCTARKPKCDTCIIQDLCQYPHKNLTE